MKKENNDKYLLLAGDLVPTQENENDFIQGDINNLLGKEIKKTWDKASFRVFNLETPITDHKVYFGKAGSFLGARKETFKGIKNLNPDLVCLANNHILDLEEKGASDTIELLEGSNINYIGIGKNIENMKHSYMFECENKKICIYNCCEHEFTYATNKTFGTNPFNPLKTLFQLQKIRKECDYLIVVYHGGKELYQYCTPKLQEICHSVVDAGADLIVCQHSHCISCYEEYKESTIVYGHGNFIFDLNEEDLWNKLTSEGMFVKLNLSNLNIEFIKYIKMNGKLELVSSDELDDFYKRSSQILEDDFVENNYIENIKHSSYHYFRQLLSTQYLGFIDKKIFSSYFMKKRYKKLRLLLINYLDCEVHYENILTYLKNIKELYKS